MRLLIDTNVVIPLEDSSNILANSLSKLVRLANQNGHQILAHSSSRDDIARDPDINRRKISLSRLQKYPFLDNPPKTSGHDLRELGLTHNNDNDRVDNELLFAVYRDAINILISEDRALHKKAELLDVSERVLYVQEAAEFLERIDARTEVALPNIIEQPLHQIEVRSTFFDSLRDEYPEFNDWFVSASRAGRRAWVHKDDDGDLGAVAIFKEEENEIVTDDNRVLPGRVLKLCTLKVGEKLRGRKIGELLLNCAFHYASENEMDYIYLTVRQGKHAYLEDLCLDFGFRLFGEKKSDHVYIKEHPGSPPAELLTPLEYHKMYYPHFRCDKAMRKFLVPIQPPFHQKLFPEAQTRPTLFNASVGNAIKQAYLCHAKVGSIKEGDILLFYRSQDEKVITTIGIVESVNDYDDPDKILELVSKRTVYSYEEIQVLAQQRTKVILFRTAVHFPVPISRDWLSEELGIVGSIQTIRHINDEAFREIISESGINNCFYAD